MNRPARDNLSEDTKRAIAESKVVATKCRPGLAAGAEASRGLKWAVAEAKAKFNDA